MSFSRESIVVKYINQDESCASLVRHLYPWRMTHDESLLLGQILTARFNTKDRFLDAGLWCVESCRDGGKPEKTYVHIHSGILLRPSESHPSQMRGEIIGRRIGHGHFGEVFRVSGTLIPQGDGSLLCKRTSRVIKVHTHTHQIGKKEVEFEAEIGRRTAYLHPKRPYHTDGKSYSVLRYFEGNELFDFITDMDVAPWRHQTDRELKIILNMLHAVKEQLHDRGIVSRDIKPENMLLNGYTKDIVNIDMGLAKFTYQQDMGVRAGTVGYLSPEVYSKLGSSRQSDIFSLGIVIGSLLGAEPMMVFTEDQLFLAIHNVAFNGIFKCFPDLDLCHQSVLLDMLKAMTSVDPADRTPIRDAISIVEKIILERKLEVISKSRQDNLQQAYDSAVLLRKKMDSVSMSAADTSKSYGTFALMEMLVEQLQAGLGAALDGFSDDPAAVDLFVSTMRLRFSGLETRADVRDKLHELINRFLQEKATIKMCMDAVVNQVTAASRMRIAIPKEVDKEITLLLMAAEGRINKYAPVVGNLPLWCDKLAKTTASLLAVSQRVEEMLAVSCLTRRPSFSRMLGVFAMPAMPSDSIVQRYAPRNST